MRNPILKQLFLIISLLAGQLTMATTYYVSPTGSDSNNGTSAATAWQNIARVNQISSSLQPGDKVLFQRGGTYRGKLSISSNGSAAAKIEVGAYGTGARPIIKGSVAVTNWTNHSGNIWRAPHWSIRKACLCERPVDDHCALPQHRLAARGPRHQHQYH